MSKLMILGANSLQVPLIQEAKNLGHTVITVSPNKNEPGHLISDINVECDVTNELKVLHWAVYYDIDGILTDQTDIAVRTVAFVAEKMNLPGIGYETACLFTDKFLMREKCKKLGIKTLEYYLVEDLDEAKEAYRKLSGEAILKPVDSQGSKGVYHIQNEAELISKFSEAKKYSRHQKFLIERFVKGKEFVVEGIVFDGKVDNLIVGDTFYFDIPDVFSATSRIFPSSVDEEIINRLEKLNKTIISNFGIKRGITHSEFIMDGDDIILIETAARGGGVFISSDIIPALTGLKTEKFLISIALDEIDEMPQFVKNLCSCCYLAFYLPRGIVESARGIAETKSLPYTLRNNLDDIKKGKIILKPQDKTSRFFVVIKGKDDNDLKNNMIEVKTLLDSVKVLSDSGEVLGPIWR